MVNRRVEDYLEAVYTIVKDGKRAQTGTIAKSLNVKPASVTEMIQRLDEKGLVIHKKYEGVSLTKKGERIAKTVKMKHGTISKLLQTIQVPKSIAEKDACVMEHSLSPKTIGQLVKFVNFIKTSPVKKPDWMKHFKLYCKTGRHPECKHKK